MIAFLVGYGEQNMKEIEVTFGRVLRIWFAWIWRALLFAMLGGSFAGFLVGFAAAMLGVAPQKVAYVNLGIGAILGLYFSVWSLGKVLKKKFPTFRIALIEESIKS